MQLQVFKQNMKLTTQILVFNEKGLKTDWDNITAPMKNYISEEYKEQIVVTIDWIEKMNISSQKS